MGLFEAVVDGILGGGVYALMAIGLTLIFGILDIINIAQGILVVLAAYLSYVLSARFHIDLLVGLVITIPVMFVIGVAIQWLFIRPLRGPERVSMSLLASYAVMIIVEGALYTIFSPTQVQLHAWYVDKGVRIRVGSYVAHVNGRSKALPSYYHLPYIYLFGFGVAVLLVVGIYFMLYRTKFGRSVRALMQDQTAARLIGVDVNRVAAITFGIGVAVTAVGGMVYGSLNAFNANTGYDLISRLLAIIILGGMGSIAGALVASVFMITVESVVTVYYPNWSVIVFYAALVLVLTVRPTGLLGRKEARAQ